MTADMDSLVLEQLRAIRADVAELKREAGATNLQLATMGQQLGALTTAVYGGKSEIEELKRRLERVERRLELTEG
jgi:septal ring factor EnvC (AmiA/AmiB activator)